MSALKLLAEARDYIESKDRHETDYRRDLLARIDALLATGGWIPLDNKSKPKHATWIRDSTKNVWVNSSTDGNRYIFPLPPLPEAKNES